MAPEECERAALRPRRAAERGKLSAGMKGSLIALMRSVGRRIRSRYGPLLARAQ